MCCPLEIHFPNRTVFLYTFFLLVIGIFQAFHLYSNLLQLISHHDGGLGNDNNNIKVFHKQHRNLKQQQKQQEKDSANIPNDDADADVNNIVVDDEYSSSIEKKSSKSSSCSTSHVIQLGNDALEKSILPSSHVSRGSHEQEKNEKKKQDDDKDLFRSTNDIYIPFKLNERTIQLNLSSKRQSVFK